jgi:hypothetical protein
MWRVPLALQAVWPGALLCGLYWVPESPRWLVMHDRVPEAKAILEKLHSHAKTLDNEYALAELYQIQKQVVIDRTLPSSWAHMFKKPSYRKRAFLALGTTGIQLYIDPFADKCSNFLIQHRYYSMLRSSCYQQ